MERLMSGNLFKLKSIMLAGLCLCFFNGKDASAFTLNVVNSNGEAVGGYRWLVEEDVTHHVTPGQSDGVTPAVRFHRSYMPVVAKGDHTTADDIAVDPAKHYFVSVLAQSGHTLGGAPVRPNQGSVTVILNSLPIPTAQITVFAFHDNQPINNAPDLPEEQGLQGFKILLEDAAGRYGMAGGQILADAFGNPLGTSYKADGTVEVMGNGNIETDANGMVVIKNLPPGKYGVQIVPPAGEDWVQTTTIEGSKVIDAWVKANEPPYFAEFGPPGWHVFAGFVKPINDTSVLTGSSAVTGQIVNLHLSRPPDYAFYNGAPFEYTRPWVGLNDLAVGKGNGIYAQRTNPDGTFSINNVPPGNYQLVAWDENLTNIIALKALTVGAGGHTVTLGDVPVFSWFARLESRVFLDDNENGFRDEGETGIPEVTVNLRLRDGTIYQSFPTDMEGYVPFDEIFPFFSWLVAEVDFARFKATGATIVVDDGGPVNPDQGWSYPSGGNMTPQPQFCTAAHVNEGAVADAGADGQTGTGDDILCTLSAPINNPNTGNNLSRTETGPVLTQGFQAFLGQTNRIEWGKKPYGFGENGGISGIVYYATTRAEDDPAKAAAEEWEPGVPRMPVVLYADGDVDKAPYGWRDGTGLMGAEDIDWNGDGVFQPSNNRIDDLNGDGVVTLSDVDNYPFGWADGSGPMGPEDIERSGSDGVYDLGDAIKATTTDSWDDSFPTGCQGEPFIYNGEATDCYDGLRNFNQVRPAVFDGGYAFDDIPAATYIVEAAPHRSTRGAVVYQTIREEDKNVDFGEDYTPSPLLLPPPCVNYDENDGQGHLVPSELALFSGVPAPFAGEYRPLCDRKSVVLKEGANAAADFFVFTETPVAGHIKGFILDDISNEFDPNSPQFGEKYAPPFIPVSIRDWTGREISRVYSDEWGNYNALVPSTYTMNMATPSGASPNMLTTCMNDPGPIPDPANPGQYITDPHFNRQYSQFCYTFQYMPGTTTYLDTPVLPVAAFAGPDQFPLDCEYPDGTPRIYSVSGPGGGPYVSAVGEQITIVSEGTAVDVPNPAYDGPGGANPKLITRDYSFGNVSGTVTINGIPLDVTAWTEGAITATVPEGVTTGELVVTRGDNGISTEIGVTVTVGKLSKGVSVRAVAPGSSIQQAIDTAQPGDLILVPPGNYEENVIMWKPVRLQGWGAGSTFINAVNTPAEKLLAWRSKVESLVTSGAVSLLPAQEIGFGGVEPETLAAAEGAGITVISLNRNENQGGFGNKIRARIDGFNISGADNGGGVFVNGYAHFLEISNNRITNNQGFSGGGGIRIGHPYMTNETNGTHVYQSGFNDNILIHSNHISQNSTLSGAGGGIALYPGSDAYQVVWNYICGNMSFGDGGGIGHMGLSDNGLIANNSILFNQSFNQGNSVSGGGIIISGNAALPGELLGPGSGSVRIVSNLIQGNLSGAGDGGGIRTQGVNGQDVERKSNQPRNWYSVDMFNNMIVNNVAGLAGGGISLQDTAMSRIIGNTIANNDSTATAGLAFSPGNPNQSTPQPAGVVSRVHSSALADAFGNGRLVAPYREFSNPEMVNNIIRHNRSFYFIADDTQDPVFYGLLPDVAGGETPVYADLAVLGTVTPRRLNPRYSILTNTSGYDASNLSVDPVFVGEYLNGAKNQIIIPEITTAIQAAVAFDEGGNFIDVRFGPLSKTGDYHLQGESPAIDAGTAEVMDTFDEANEDCDNQLRPMGGGIDIGADEHY